MYTASHAIRASGLSYRQLDHVVRSGAVTPSGGGGHGRGSARRFGVGNLLALRLARLILNHGLQLRSWVPALRFVQGTKLPSLLALCGATLWTDGTVVVLYEKDKRRIPRRALEGVAHLVDLGAAAEHVRLAIEQIRNSHE